MSSPHAGPQNVGRARMIVTYRKVSLKVTEWLPVSVAVSHRGAGYVASYGAYKIGEGNFVRVTFTDGKAENVYGFKSELDAAKWIRCEAVAWLYGRRIELKEAASAQYPMGLTCRPQPRIGV
jgi:hypothetical protein